MMTNSNNKKLILSDFDLTISAYHIHSQISKIIEKINFENLKLTMRALDFSYSEDVFKQLSRTINFKNIEFIISQLSRSQHQNATVQKIIEIIQKNPQLIITNESLINNFDQQEQIWNQLSAEEKCARGQTSNSNDQWRILFENLLNRGDEIIVLTYSEFPFAIDLFFRETLQLSAENLAKIKVIYGTSRDNKKSHFDLVKKTLPNNQFDPKETYFFDDDSNNIWTAQFEGIKNAIEVRGHIPNPVEIIFSYLKTTAVQSNLQTTPVSTDGPMFQHYTNDATFYYTKNNNNHLERHIVSSPMQNDITPPVTDTAAYNENHCYQNPITSASKELLKDPSSQEPTEIISIIKITK